jgi:putative glycosyltransferase (TIGR04348 family)
MLALHAKKSRDSMLRYVHAQPGSPLILALTGTDLYRDIRFNADARNSISLAARIIVLQEHAVMELPADAQKKTRVIYQSAPKLSAVAPYKRYFEVCILGHLREEKDPFRCAFAAGYLPPSSRVRITHLGRALDSQMEQQANKLAASEQRYRWLGEVTHKAALTRLARSHLMVISSRMEGGANVVSEAIAARVPVIASNISGNIGMLGKNYGGYYPLEDERTLARLMWRAESDKSFYQLLRRQISARMPLVSPAREKAALRSLLNEITSGD